MRVLAFDLGSRLGVATRDTYGTDHVQVYDLGFEQLARPGKSRGKSTPADRFHRFDSLLNALLDPRPDVVLYEDVKAHASTEAGHVYGGFRAILQVHCKRLGVEYVPVGVWEIKRIATGAGGGKKAGKEQMIEAARHRWPHMEITDDNAADALWLLEWHRNRVA